MGRTISDGLAFPPTAKLGVVGAMFKGRLISKRLQDFGNGEKSVYRFAALDADCSFRSGKQDVPAPEEGAEVELIPTSRLAVQLAQAINGKVYTITRLADGKKNKFGKCPHVFDVQED